MGSSCRRPEPLSRKKHVASARGEEAELRETLQDMGSMNETHKSQFKSTAAEVSEYTTCCNVKGLENAS